MAQVVLAARAAAGLNRGGMRRTAFSMGDLQALEVVGPPSPPETPRSVHRRALPAHSLVWDETTAAADEQTGSWQGSWA